jgi:hypothetical protein
MTFDGVDGFFYMTIDDVYERTLLTREMQDKARNKLIELNIIQYKVKGSPPKRYFKLNVETLIKFISEEQSPPETPKKTPKIDKPEPEFSQMGDPANQFVEPPNLCDSTNQDVEFHKSTCGIPQMAPRDYKDRRDQTLKRAEQAEQTRVAREVGEAPPPPMPACLPAACNSEKEDPRNPADRTDEENIEILRNDLKWAFDESKMTRAIEFYKRMTWDELAKCQNLTGKIRHAVEKGWDLERTNKSYHPSKNSEAYRATESKAVASRQKASQFDDLDLSGPELNEAIAIAAKEVFGGKCLPGTGIEVMCGLVEFYWTMGSDEILFCLTNGEFWHRISERLIKWGFDPKMLRSIIFQDHLRVVKG